MARKKKAKAKAKEGKETIRQDSPRRLVNGMIEKLEACRDALDNVVNHVDDGHLDNAIDEIGKAQSAYEGIRAGAFDNVARQLQVAENEIADVILRMNR